jgi:hypothetical protein
MKNKNLGRSSHSISSLAKSLNSSLELSRRLSANLTTALRNSEEKILKTKPPVSSGQVQHKSGQRRS